jgi:negative regulator of sigma E activity
MATKKKYHELTDLQRLQKQWRKLSGLHTREEWSAAIVRAATAAEIAANVAVRREFEAKSQFTAQFVDALLIWANGLIGKVDRLLLPLTADAKERNNTLKKLRTIAAGISSKRNAIVHQGEFCNEEEAKAVISQSREFITTLMHIYEPAFLLKEGKH